MKLAVFQVILRSQERGQSEKVVFSSLEEQERDNFYKNLGEDQYQFRIEDTVLDFKKLGENLIGKLDGNDKMLLDRSLGFDCFTQSLTFPFYDINIECYTPSK